MSKSGFSHVREWFFKGLPKWPLMKIFERGRPNKKKGFKINYENQYLHAIFLTKTVILYSILLYSMYVPGGWAGHPHHDLR